MESSNLKQGIESYFQGKQLAGKDRHLRHLSQLVEQSGPARQKEPKAELTQIKKASLANRKGKTW